MNKNYADATAPPGGVLFDRMPIASGGFGLSSVPARLLDTIQQTDMKDLTFAANSATIDGQGIGKLLHPRRVRKMIVSHVGEDKKVERQYLSSERDVEFTPQGTVADRPGTSDLGKQNTTPDGHRICMVSVRKHRGLHDG